MIPDGNKAFAAINSASVMLLFVVSVNPVLLDDVPITRKSDAMDNASELIKDWLTGAN